MKRALISVEGQTEETFVREVLAAHFKKLDILLTPTLVTTKVVKSGPNFKGGLTSYERAKRDIVRLLSDSNAVAVTTMYDLYGLPETFPGYDTRPAAPYEKVKHLEDTFHNDIDHPRFRPYIQLHEFEAFLFVEPDVTAVELALNPHQTRALVEIRSTVSTSEEINDNPKTAPSRRLRDIYQAYDKAFDGPLVTLSVGLERLRADCLHFNEWLEWLENL